MILKLTLLSSDETILLDTLGYTFKPFVFRTLKKVTTECTSLTGTKFKVKETIAEIEQQIKEKLNA